MAEQKAEIREVLRVERFALEMKSRYVQKELDDQIEALQSVCAKAKESGRFSALCSAESALGKLLDVRADACRSLANALLELAEQERVLA